MHFNAGDSVTLPSGETIHPDQVLGAERPARSIALTGDTAPVATVVAAAEGADLLVHEATFCADELQRARETGHSTAGQAALVAREAGVKMLALTHVSSRYFGREVGDEARQLFPNTVVPGDFDIVEIPFPSAASRRSSIVVPAAARPRVDASTAGDVTHGAACRTSTLARGVYDTLRPTDASWWEAFEHLVELGDLRGRRVLDVGCGTGRLAAALSGEARAKVWGIDSSDEMVAVAREDAPGRRRRSPGRWPNGSRFATGGSTGSRCRSSSISSTVRGPSPKPGASSGPTGELRSAHSIPITSSRTGSTRTFPRSGRSTGAVPDPRDDAARAGAGRVPTIRGAARS